MPNSPEVVLACANEGKAEGAVADGGAAEDGADAGTPKEGDKDDEDEAAGFASASAPAPVGAPNTAGAFPLMGRYPPELACAAVDEGFAAAAAGAAGFAATPNSIGALPLIGG